MLSEEARNVSNVTQEEWQASKDSTSFQQQCFEELKEIVCNLPKVVGKGESFDRILAVFISVVKQFKEHRSLLDPLLPAILPTLIGYVLDPTSSDFLRLDSCKLLYALQEVRGSKAIVNHLPCEVGLVQPVLSLLERHLEAGDQADSWKEPYVLLLWLNALCQTPFQLYCYQQGGENVGENLLHILIEFFNCRSMLKETAAKVLSSFVTRPDMVSYMIEQFETSLKEIAKLQGTSSSEDTYTLDAWCIFLIRCFKKGRRDDLLGHAGRIYNELKSLDSCAWTNSNSVRRRKFWAKLIQRIGMVFLKPRQATWAYQRGTRSLLVTPSNISAGETVEEPLAEKDEEACMDQSLTPEVDEILNTLFVLLRDKDTIVRWSAARGIGRICSRLSKTLVSNVVNSTVDLFSPLHSLGCWHGGCLVLAELGRRGLLLPEHLPRLVGVMQRGLYYDGNRYGFSGGAIVRDAACYVCWSFARAFDAKDLQSFDLELARSLVCVILFDREVNCRRAASAAFQEIVGRLGIFPHGVEIFTRADYYAVASRTLCYTEILVFVAEFSEYTRSLIADLLANRVSHADESIRSLAAQALQLLVRFDRFHFLLVVVPELLAMVRTADTIAQHGAILALASVIVALFKQCENSSGQLVKTFNHFQREVLPVIIDIPKIMEEKRAFSKGRQMMLWTAIADLYENIFLEGKFQTSYEQMHSILQLLEESMFSSDSKVRLAISRAYRAMGTNMDNFLNSFHATEINLDVNLKLDAILCAKVEHRCIASIMIVGSLSKGVLASRMDKVITILTSCFNDKRYRRLWWEAKETCLIAMRNFCLSFVPSTGRAADERMELLAGHFYKIYDHQIAASKLKERTVKGDVTLHIRRAAIENIREFIKHAIRHNLFMMPDRIAVGFKQLITESLDGNLTQRQIACDSVSELLLLDSLSSSIPCFHDLVEIFLSKDKNGQSPTWELETFAYTRLSKLLSLSYYQYGALFGYIIAAGSASVSLSTVTSKELLNYFRKMRSIQWKLKEYFENFLQVCSDYSHFKWFALPMLRVLEKLLLSEFTDDRLQSQLHTSYLERILYLADVCWTEAKNIPVLEARISVYCGCILPFRRRLASFAIQRTLSYLTHPFPVIRRYAAERLFEHLTMITLSDSTLMVNVFQILEQTDWNAAVEDVEHIRDQLVSLLNTIVSA
ncbi:TFCD C domain containing protein [Trichuris trichiura]|uniref:Tubulin-specific chaperone D n=1 Tax=Trichuris trichiura TaxID=36087 RepID=A0A077Z9L9_TRITR|nr:TFCD C domain containing protein [Trichuris trichiura]